MSAMTLSVARVHADDWHRFRALRLAALADSPEMFGSTLRREQAFSEEEWRRRAQRPTTSVAASAQVAYGLGLLVFMAAMFTAGTWTPGPLMPESIRIISGFTPMGAMTQALTDAWYTGAVSVAPFLVMFACALPCGALALKVFKWR